MYTEKYYDKKISRNDELDDSDEEDGRRNHHDYGEEKKSSASSKQEVEFSFIPENPEPTV